MNNQAQTIPTGTLKQINIKDIKRDLLRFRSDFGNIESLAESIREKGVLQPITLTPDLHILAGERRIKAAELAGLEKIPALIRKIDGEIDAREIELIENTFRTNFTWQEEANIVAEIDRLYKEKNLDWSGRKTAQLIGQSTSNTSRQLEMARSMAVLPELAEQKTFDDAYKMLKKFEETAIIDELRRRQQQQVNAPDGTGSTGTNLGDYTPDLKQRLKIADSNYRISDTFLALAELQSDGYIHIIECDPPYGINLNAVKGSKDSVDSNVHSYNEVPADKYAVFLGTLALELYRVAAKDAWLVFWYGPSWHHEVKTSLQGAGWHVDDIPAIWAKTQGQTLQPEVYLARGYEPFFLCRKGQPIMAKRGRLNVFNYPGTPSGQKYHPTERPIPLIEDILTTLGVPGQIVLVPFLGSGATLRACYKLGMKGFGFDKSSEYKDRFLLAVEEDSKSLTTTEA